MGWPTPEYSKSQVNKAGKIFVNLSADRDLEEFLWAFDVLNNWRSCHGYPINTFQATMRQKLKSVNPDALVAQRLKRMPSIISKLVRNNSMQLARMQDIGGLRAVVGSLEHVRELEKNYRDSQFQHELVASKDYISFPKESGYRSTHLIYKYKNPRVPEYDGLLLELQIRTRLQHAWATAVETVGTFLNQSLKASEGSREWLNFFSLASAAFAQLESSAPVPGYENLSKNEVFAATIDKVNALEVREKLTAFSIAAEQVYSDRRNGRYHLIELNPSEKSVSIKSYSQSNLEEANQQYSDAERRIAEGASIQVVLVSAGSVENLRYAYPNYFLDTGEFVKQLNSHRNAAMKGSLSLSFIFS